MRIVFEIEHTPGYSAINREITRLFKRVSNVTAKHIPSLSLTSSRIPGTSINLLISTRPGIGVEFNYVQKDKEAASVTISCFERNDPHAMSIASQFMEAISFISFDVEQRSYLPFCTWEESFNLGSVQEVTPLLKEYFKYVGVASDEIHWADDWEEIFDSLYPKVSYIGLIAFALDTGKANIGRGCDGEFTLELDSKYSLPEDVNREIERQMYGNAISKIGDIAMKFTQSLIGEYCRRMVDLQTKGENPDDFTVECSFDNPELDLVRNKVTKTPDPL